MSGEKTSGLAKIKSFFEINKHRSGGSQPIYARLNDGSDTYNYEFERAGLLNYLNGTSGYYTALNDYRDYYFKISYVADLIDLTSNIITEAEIFEVRNSDNSIVEDSEWIKLLNNPNPYQTRAEFLKEALINRFTSGVSIFYSTFFQNGNLRAYNNNLYNIHYNRLLFPKVRVPYAITDRDMRDFKVIEQLENGDRRTLKFSQIGWVYDIGKNAGMYDGGYKGEMFFAPIPRLSSVRFQMQTLMNANDTMAYISNNPVLGILSKKTKDGAVAPLNGEEKNDIERKLNGKGGYGASVLGKGGIIASNEEHTYNSLLVDISKLQLIPMTESAKNDIRSRFNVPRDLSDATDGKNSTYENKQTAEALYINGFCKSYLNDILECFMKRSAGYFESRGTRLVCSFDHFPSIQVADAEGLYNGLNLKMDSLIKAQQAYEKYITLEAKPISYEQFMINNGFDDLLTHKK